MSRRNQAAIVGIGSTEMVRSSDRSLGSFAVEAVRNAIADAGLEAKDIDGYVGSPGAPNAAALHADGLDEVSSTFMISALGLDDLNWAMDVEGMPTGMIVAAAHALAAGTCRYVVAVRAHYNPPDRKYNKTSVDLAAGPSQFMLPYGYGPAGTRFALRLKRYMHDHGATREDLYQIVQASRRHARLNPLAVWRSAPELSLDAYMNARMIHEPMCLFDSDLPITAACAIVLTTAERARDLPQRPAYVASFANANKPLRVFEAVGIGPGDVQVVQLPDGFSMMVWLGLEELGFCDIGQAHRFAKADQIGPGGVLPVNTFGGSLGEGRLHGMGHVREAVLQATGRAGERQIRDVRYSLVHVGSPERFWTVLLSPHPN